MRKRRFLCYHLFILLIIYSLFVLSSFASNEEYNSTKSGVEINLPVQRNIDIINALTSNLQLIIADEGSKDANISHNFATSDTHLLPYYLNSSYLGIWNSKQMPSMRKKERSNDLEGTEEGSGETLLEETSTTLTNPEGLLQPDKSAYTTTNYPYLTTEHEDVAVQTHSSATSRYENSLLDATTQTISTTTFPYVNIEATTPKIGWLY